MRKVLKMLAIPVLALALIALAGWIGLQIKPDPFPAFAAPEPDFDTIPLPDDLPAPVARFYRVAMGDDIPVITSAVMTGPAELRVAGITFNSRFRITHEAGHNYRHYIEATVFGAPLLKVDERYVDNISLMELPFGTTENEPKINQAANLGLWGESLWLPSVFLTDPRVRWEAVDETHARLIVPFTHDGTVEEEIFEEVFDVTFDAETGLIDCMEAMRYKEKDSAEKTHWLLEALEWGEAYGMQVLRVGSITWADEGTPWATFTVDEIIYNADVTAYIRQKGL